MLSQSVQIIPSGGNNLAVVNCDSFAMDQNSLIKFLVEGEESFRFYHVGSGVTFFRMPSSEDLASHGVLLGSNHADQETPSSIGLEQLTRVLRRPKQPPPLVAAETKRQPLVSPVHGFSGGKRMGMAREGPDYEDVNTQMQCQAPQQPSLRPSSIPQGVTTHTVGTRPHPIVWGNNSGEASALRSSTASLAMRRESLSQQPPYASTTTSMTSSPTSPYCLGSLKPQLAMSGGGPQADLTLNGRAESSHPGGRSSSPPREVITVPNDIHWDGQGEDPAILYNNTWQAVGSNIMSELRFGQYTDEGSSGTPSFRFTLPYRNLHVTCVRRSKQEARRDLCLFVFKFHESSSARSQPFPRPQ